MHLVGRLSGMVSLPKTHTLLNIIYLILLHTHGCSLYVVDSRHYQQQLDSIQHITINMMSIRGPCGVICSLCFL